MSTLFTAVASTTNPATPTSGVGRGAVAARAARLRCFHCGEDVMDGAQYRTLFDGESKAACCVGCVSVIEAIVAADLGDYYRHRDGYAARADTTRLIEVLGASPSSASTNALSNGSGETKTLSFYVNGMHCAACVWLTERTLAALPGVSEVNINFAARACSLRYNDALCQPAQPIAALNRIGLDAEVMSMTDHEALRKLRDRARKREWFAFGVAALCMMQVMMLVVPVYLAEPGDIEPDSARLMAWSAWLLTLPVLLVSARSILRRMVAELIGSLRARDARNFSMDTPIGVALVTTFVTSTLSLVTGHGQHYFDAISMFVTLILGTRLIESGLRRRTLDTIERLSNAKPLQASRLCDFPSNETTELVSAVALRAGDFVHIGVGDVVPADATVVRGKSELDESLLTGESRPVMRQRDDALLAGSVNTHSPLIAKVTAAGDATVAAQLARKVEANLLARRPSSFVDALTRWLAPATLLLAALSFAAWWWVSQDAVTAMNIAVAVLVVTCPCAVALAIPAVQAALLGRLTISGLLVTRPHVAETLAAATDIVFDKTGTLTTGAIRVVNAHYRVSMKEVNALVNAMEQGCNHPVGNALKSVCAEPQDGVGVPTIEAVTHHAGRGVEATIDGQRFRLGVPQWALLQSSTTDDGSDTSTVILARTDGVHAEELARFQLADELRADAKDAIALLQRMGLNVHILSGDAQVVVTACARTLGVDAANARARQTPAEKQAVIEALVKQGHTVIAVGDGTNDAQMLSCASVGIGMASGTALTKLSADAVQSTDRTEVLSKIADGIELTRRGKRAMQQNLGWALAYNVIAVPMAVLGLVTPLWAAFGMAASSLVVVINAARLSLPTKRVGGAYD